MLNIRAHHILCTENFVGEGYSDSFSKNISKIIYKLKENPKVRLIASVDDICKACPENDGKRCSDYEKVKNYDLKVLEYLGFFENQIINWGDVKKASHDIIFKGHRRTEICEDCKWNGLCLEIESSKFKRR